MKRLVALVVLASVGAVQAKPNLPMPPPPVPKAKPAPEGKPKLLVLELTAGAGVAPELAKGFTENITAQASARGFFDVVSTQEIQTLLGLERQKQMLGCSEDAQSCLTELAGAIGARFVLSGSLSKLGDAYQLSLQTLDSAKARPLARSTRIANDLATVRAQISFAIAEATATPLPPPPSRVLPYSLMGAGALAVIGGGLLGLQALTLEGSVNRELENGRSNPAALETLSSYRAEAQNVALGKTVSLAILAAGAGLIGLGIAINPPESVSSQGVSVSLWLTPHQDGVAISGAFP